MSAQHVRCHANASGRGLHSLDWLNFFIANLQTGFGPFIAVYLTAHKWTQVEIGVALSVGSLVTMLGQLPAGALVDWLYQKRAAAAGALIAIAASAILLAVWPQRLPVYTAQALHGFASCLLVPAVAAITLNRVGRAAFAERLGRNASFAALGNGIGAALMGISGAWVSSQSVFWLAAAFCVPALVALSTMSPRPSPVKLGLVEPMPEPERPGGLRVLVDRRLLAFAFCALLFQFANAAMLPLAGAEVTKQAGDTANLVIAACLLVPQLVVAGISPWIGRLAERWGRRPVLLLGFAALPLRALLFAWLTHPIPIVVAQLFDGIGGAVFGVMVPLVSADLTRGTGHFNLCMGLVGLAVGIGATFSTTVAGEIATRLGDDWAFLALAAGGALAVAAVASLMPETRPAPELPARAEPYGHARIRVLES
jgi:MFS family permease